MLKASVKDNRVVTGKVRLSYANLNEPRSIENGPAKYSAVIVIPKDDKATYDAIRKAQAHTVKNGKHKWGGKIPPSFKGSLFTMHDGDEEADLERNPEYEGCWYMNVSNTRQPGLLDRARQPILDATEVYSGCYARVAISCFPFNQQGNKGVSFGLDHVQKLADGEPLGNMITAEAAFDDLDDDEDLEDEGEYDDEDYI